MRKIGYEQVISMARETGIDIFAIYFALKVEPDPETKEIWKNLSNQKTPEGKRKAFERYFEHAQKMGMDVEENSVPYTEYEKWSVTISKKRIATGIPWGTEKGVEILKEKATKLETLEECTELYKLCPIGSEERNEMIRVIAKFFSVPA